MKQVHLVTLLGLAAGLSTLWAPVVAPAATITVNPGDSIQAAVDAAAPGDTVKVMPGDYTEPAASGAAVRITKSIKLLAKSKLKDNIRVRILAGPGQTDGILVEPTNPGDPDIVGLKIQGFTVEGFPNNGIWLRHVQNFTIQGNESVNNLENGIWPTLSANGSVKKNVSYGAEDSALWVEASENIRVMQNELYDSPTGLEITISKNVQATKNNIHDNTVGVGLYHPNGAGLISPPNLLAGGDWVIKGNRIVNNNRPNTVTSGLVSGLPPGLGVLVVGVDRVTIDKNEITGNDFVGVAMLDWCIALDGTPNSCNVDPPLYQPAPDGNTVKGNTLGDNGGNPPNDPTFGSLAGDLALVAFPWPPWSPIGGHGNCISPLQNKAAPPQMTVTYNHIGSVSSECN